MRRATLAALLALGLVGCATQQPELKPAPAANAARSEDFAATAALAGVRVTVDGDAWFGEPQSLDSVVPLRVTVENRAGRPLRLRYREMERVTFQLELVDAETGRSFGTVRLPFTTLGA